MLSSLFQVLVPIQVMLESILGEGMLKLHVITCTCNVGEMQHAVILHNTCTLLDSIWSRYIVGVTYNINAWILELAKGVRIIEVRLQYVSRPSPTSTG